MFGVGLQAHTYTHTHARYAHAHARTHAHYTTAMKENGFNGEYTFFAYLMLEQRFKKMEGT